MQLNVGQIIYAVSWGCYPQRLIICRVTDKRAYAKSLYGLSELCFIREVSGYFYALYSGSRDHIRYSVSSPSLCAGYNKALLVDAFSHLDANLLSGAQLEAMLQIADVSVHLEKE
jgi:hypothetical protein